VQATHRFRDGELFIHEDTFPEGMVRLRGLVHTDRAAKVLRLWDVEIDPVPPGRRWIGPRNVLAFFAGICRLAAVDGFDRLVVEGHRISGANPDRPLGLEFDCR
jgi:hypothetical protein